MATRYHEDIENDQNRECKTMSGIDLVALLSFAVLVVTWAILPSRSSSVKETAEELPAVAMTPVHESR